MFEKKSWIFDIITSYLSNIYYVYAMNIMHSPEHEIIIAPVYATQTNSWNDISKAVKSFEFYIEIYRVLGYEVGCASAFRKLGLNS